MTRWWVNSYVVKHSSAYKIHTNLGEPVLAPPPRFWRKISSKASIVLGSVKILPVLADCNGLRLMSCGIPGRIMVCPRQPKKIGLNLVGMGRIIVTPSIKHCAVEFFRLDHCRQRPHPTEGTIRG